MVCGACAYAGAANSGRLEERAIFVNAIDRAANRLFTGPVQQVRKRLSTFGTEQAELVLLLLLVPAGPGSDWP